MTILEIINEAAARLNEPTLTTAFSTTNNQAVMYLASANKMGRDIAKRTEWGSLTVPTSFTTIDGVQSYSLPEDFKEMQTNNLYNATQQWSIDKETGDMAEGYISTGNSSWTDSSYRIVAKKIRFTVPADTEDLIRYEYRSKAISTDCDANLYNTFQDDDSLFTLDEEALIRGIAFDITRKYGFPDAVVLKQEYEEEIADLVSKDGGKYVISSKHEYKKYPYPRRWNRTTDEN